MLIKVKRIQNEMVHYGESLNFHANELLNGGKKHLKLINTYCRSVFSFQKHDKNKKKH